MRYVVFGAGAIGGVVGARLVQGGHQVVLVARGAHLEAIVAHGLRVDAPSGSDVVTVHAVGHPADISWRDDDVVLLSVKSQDTPPALHSLVASGIAPSAAVVCLQNGVANEREASRRFANVYGATVMCPSAHLQPGVVATYSAPLTGALDIGRFPSGVDAVATTLCDALGDATFSARPVADVQRWKYRKLLGNLTNAVEAVCGPAERRGPLGMMATEEGERVLAAAGIDVATVAEDRARRDGVVAEQPIAGVARSGGSSWQSLQRRTGTVETPYLNGEIVMLGRMAGVATPVNALLVRLADALAAGRAAPGSISRNRFMALLPADP